MKTAAEFKHPPTGLLLPVIVLLIMLVAKPAMSAIDGIELTPYEFGLSANVFGHSSGAPFQLPEELVTKNGFTALDLNGQPSIPILGIKGLFDVSDLVVINGVSGKKEIRGNIAVGYEIGSFGDLEVFSDTSAGALAKYGQDPVGGVINLATRRVPVGSNLSGPALRPAGTYHDFQPFFSKKTSPLRAVWAWDAGIDFGPDAVGVVTEDSAFRIVQAGDPVPDRPIPAPNGTGSTYTDFDSFSVSLNTSYAVYKGSGDFFNGAYTYRVSDGERFTVAESFTLGSNFGAVFGCFLHGDREVIFGTALGIYRGDAEGETPAEAILANGTEWEPGKTFNSGQLHHVSGDWAAIAGSGDDNFLSTILLLNLNDLSVTQIAQEGEEMPGGAGGETFRFVQRPGVSEEMVVFEGFDEGFQFAGVFARMLDTWELLPVIRVGQMFDGREVRTMSFYPGAVEGANVGLVNYYTDGSSGAYLVTMDYDFTVPFGNISTRLAIGSGDDAGIGGFINTLKPGTNQTVPLDVGAKQVVIRAIGPSLGALGVAGPLADPVLELYDVTGALITSNDNWRDTQEQEIMDAGLAPTDDLEAAILTTLELGAYTAVVRGSNGSTGVGLVEIYDLDGAAVSELANISTRGSVQTGDGVMIGGFIVGGTESTASTMVVRAIGPSLTGFGVANALQDPTLELHDGSGALIASNDNWKDTQQTALEAAGLAPTDDREAALEIALGPGLYTAIVRGAGDTTGVALVEAYNLEASAAPAAFPVTLTNRR